MAAGGAVAPAHRARQAEVVLRGQKIDEALIEAAAETAMRVKPISDVRASAEYRREMVRVLTGRAVQQAVAN
ncbi:MAG: hypothetical protein U0401_21855 [Anaerolineae bacterium]